MSSYFTHTVRLDCLISHHSLPLETQKKKFAVSLSAFFVIQMISAIVSLVITSVEYDIIKSENCCKDNLCLFSYE